MTDKGCPNYFHERKCKSDGANESKSCSGTYADSNYEDCPYQDKDGK